jgi:hypothetical protein
MMNPLLHDRFIMKLKDVLVIGGIVTMIWGGIVFFGKMVTLIDSVQRIIPVVDQDHAMLDNQKRSQFEFRAEVLRNLK